MVGTERRVQRQLVGEVQLGDVDPPLLRQLDEDPDRRRGDDPEPHAVAGRGHRRKPDHLVGDEEVLEGVGEDQQQRAPTGSARTRRRRPAGRSRGTARPGTPAGWSSSAGSTGRRSPGSRRPSPCRSPGSPEGRARTPGRSTGRPRRAPAPPAGREGKRGISSGTKKREPTTARNTTVSRRHGRPRPRHDVDIGPPPRRRRTWDARLDGSHGAGPRRHPEGVSRDRVQGRKAPGSARTRCRTDRAAPTTAASAPRADRRTVGGSHCEESTRRRICRSTSGAIHGNSGRRCRRARRGRGRAC